MREARGQEWNWRRDLEIYKVKLDAPEALGRGEGATQYPLSSGCGGGQRRGSGLRYKQGRLLGGGNI